MKRVAILCQTGPAGKRRLAEEALRLAAGLTATGRLRVDLILSASALALLQPEMGGPIGTWESVISPQTRILVPSGTPLPSSPPVTFLPNGDPEKVAQGADLILRF
ncbi:MAG TPA: hypothetical protein DEO44_06230 [Verrucomicrobia subdivision 6 bacterium]|jgi:hypothetical protein|uniref:Uncharacterized protein n=1 Tax=Verrucomicrobia subdivision 6 bacterium BACL9 MAG-120507-bin52 TaxID=1655590 RepID=A0A0R2RFE7_9BACT|nr:MAG: hypothetical protein ABR82_06215 [Verrucomicrobia subdivision 6 bacterium BACL9 MAG-120507-bin52]HBZ85315.1 hypothetical protein [Verrucomicrobia subdivision 6 bacterium]